MLKNRQSYRKNKRCINVLSVLEMMYIPKINNSKTFSVKDFFSIFFKTLKSTICWFYALVKITAESVIDELEQLQTLQFARLWKLARSYFNTFIGWKHYSNYDLKTWYLAHFMSWSVVIIGVVVNYYSSEYTVRLKIDYIVHNSSNWVAVTF